MNFLFFGFIADESQLSSAFAGEAAPQVSAVKFQAALLSGLAARAQVRVVGTPPISAFPRNKAIWLQGADFSLDTGVAGRLIPVLNLPLLRLVWRFVAGLISGNRFCRADRPNAILVYALHTPFLVAAALLSWWHNVPVGVFIPDLPLHMAGRRERGLRGLMKRMDDLLLRALVKKASVVFPVTEHIARDWLPQGVRHAVIEGIAPKIEGTPALHMPPSGRKRMLYTGHFSQIANFVQLFAESSQLDVECVLMGGGPELDDISAIAARDPRIVIKPFTTGAELSKEFDEASLLINPRNSGWNGARYSFPSKLFDYMTRGIPVASTRLPGIPLEYFDAFFEIDDANQAGLAASLQDALDAGVSEYQRRIAKGFDMLVGSKSARAVADRVISAVMDC